MRVRVAAPFEPGFLRLDCHGVRRSTLFTNAVAKLSSPMAKAKIRSYYPANFFGVTNTI